jgi:hypothetical protein
MVCKKLNTIHGIGGIAAIYENNVSVGPTGPLNDVPDYSAAVRIFRTLRISELRTWKEKSGSELPNNGWTRKHHHLHIHSLRWSVTYLKGLFMTSVTAPLPREDPEAGEECRWLTSPPEAR